MSEINDVMVKYGRYFLKRMLMKLASTMLCIDNTISLRSEYSDEEILAFLESIDYPFRIFVEYVDNYSKFVRNHEVISQLYFLLLLNE